MSILDKGFKELMERLASYDKYGLKEYKDTFMVFTEALLFFSGCQKNQESMGGNRTFRELERWYYSLIAGLSLGRSPGDEEIRLYPERHDRFFSLRGLTTSRCNWPSRTQSKRPTESSLLRIRILFCVKCFFNGRRWSMSIRSFECMSSS